MDEALTSGNLGDSSLVQKAALQLCRRYVMKLKLNWKLQLQPNLN